MKTVAALAPLLLLAGNAPASLQIYVQQHVAAGQRTQVLMLDADGAFSGITSIAKRDGRDRGQLDTKRGYWLHCGSWRSLPGGRIAIHQRLSESFGYVPPPDPGRWFTSAYTIASAAGSRQLIANGISYRQVARVPFNGGETTGNRLACDAARRREPREG